MPDAGGANSDRLPLLGTDDATVDSKGRIFLTQKKRQRLGDTFAITIGRLGCVHAYPVWSWNDLSAEIKKYNLTDEAREDFSRMLFGDADDEAKCDGDGRLIVPQKMRDVAKLTEKAKVKVVGNFDHVEIWNAAEYANWESDKDRYGLKRRDEMAQFRKQMTTGSAEPGASAA